MTHRHAPLEELSLYVHIPFCTSRCRYCSFYFETGWSPRVMQACLDTILEHARRARSQVFPKGRGRINTIYFGGGTPSVIPPAQLDRFLQDFRAIWDLDVAPAFAGEWAFECNPESLTAPLLDVLAKHGINRLSIGVQTLSEEGLRLLGRRADRADVERALTLVGQYRWKGLWTGRINLDFITGIPGQTTASVASDLDWFLAQGADHVSVYTLTVEPGTSLEQLFALGQGRPVDQEGHEALWAVADHRLEAAGLHNYEVSNYARPGAESQHNLVYWRMGPWLGLGPGAVGTLPGWPLGTGDPGPDPRPLRVTNPALFAYARPGATGMDGSVEAPGPRDFFLDHLLTGLRTHEGLALDHLEGIFGPGAREACEAIEDFWRSEGTPSLALPGRLALGREGRLLLDPILTRTLEVLDHLGPRWEASLTCRWP